ncbi:MFS transporter [Escherichia coli]
MWLTHIRGKLVSFNQFQIVFWQLLVYCVNYFIARSGDASWLNTDGWRLVLFPRNVSLHCCS